MTSSVAYTGTKPGQLLTTKTHPLFQDIVLKVVGWDPEEDQKQTSLPSFRQRPSTTAPIPPLINASAVWKLAQYNPTAKKWSWTLDGNLAMATGLSLPEWKELLALTQQPENNPSTLCLLMIEDLKEIKKHVEFNKWMDLPLQKSQRSYVQQRFPAIHKFFTLYRTEGAIPTPLDGLQVELMSMPETDQGDNVHAFLHMFIDRRKEMHLSETFQYRDLLAYAEVSSKHELLVKLKVYPWTYQEFQVLKTRHKGMSGFNESRSTQTESQWRQSIIQEKGVQDVWILHIDPSQGEKPLLQKDFSRSTFPLPTWEVHYDCGQVLAHKFDAWWYHLKPFDGAVTEEWMGVVCPGWMGRHVLLVMHQTPDLPSLEKTSQELKTPDTQELREDPGPAAWATDTRDDERHCWFWDPLTQVDASSPMHTSLERVIPFRILETLHKTHLLTFRVGQEQGESAIINSLLAYMSHAEGTFEKWTAHFVLMWIESGRRLDAHFIVCCFLSLWAKANPRWLPNRRCHEFIVCAVYKFLLYAEEVPPVFLDMEDAKHPIEDVDMLHKDGDSDRESESDSDLEADSSDSSSDSSSSSSSSSSDEDETAAKKGLKKAAPTPVSRLKSDEHIRSKWTLEQLLSQVNVASTRMPDPIDPSLHKQQHMLLWLLLDLQGVKHTPSNRWLVHLATSWRWVIRKMSLKDPQNRAPLVSYEVSEKEMDLTPWHEGDPPKLQSPVDWNQGYVHSLTSWPALEEGGEPQPSDRWLNQDNWSCGLPLEQTELPYFPASFAAFELPVDERHDAKWIHTWNKGRENGFDVLLEKKEFGDTYKSILHRYLSGLTRRFYASSLPPDNPTQWSLLEDRALLSPYTVENEYGGEAGTTLLEPFLKKLRLKKTWVSKEVFHVYQTKEKKDKEAAHPFKPAWPLKDAPLPPQTIATQVLSLYFHSTEKLPDVQVYRSRYPYPKEPCGFMIICDFAVGSDATLHISIRWDDWDACLKQITSPSDLTMSDNVEKLSELWERLKMETLQAQLTKLGKTQKHWALWLNEVIRGFFDAKKKLRFTSIPYRSGWYYGQAKGRLQKVPLLTQKDEDGNTYIRLWDPKYHGLLKADILKKAPWLHCPLAEFSLAEFPEFVDLDPWILTHKDVPWAVAPQGSMNFQQTFLFCPKHEEAQTSFQRRLEETDDTKYVLIRTTESFIKDSSVSMMGQDGIRDNAWWDHFAHFVVSRCSNRRVLHMVTQSVLFPGLLKLCQLPNVQALSASPDAIWIPQVVAPDDFSNMDDIEADQQDEVLQKRQATQVLDMMEVQQLHAFFLKTGLFQLAVDAQTVKIKAFRTAYVDNPPNVCPSMTSKSDAFQERVDEAYGPSAEMNETMTFRKAQYALSPSVKLWEWSYLFSRCQTLWKDTMDQESYTTKVRTKWLQQTKEEGGADDFMGSGGHAPLEEARRAHWNPKLLLKYIQSWLSVAHVRSEDESRHLKFAIHLVLQGLAPTQSEEWTWSWSSNTSSHTKSKGKRNRKSTSKPPKTDGSNKTTKTKTKAKMTGRMLPSQLKHYPMIEGYVTVLWHWIMMSTGGLFHRSVSGTAGFFDVCHWICTKQMPLAYLDTLKDVLYRLLGHEALGQRESLTGPRMSSMKAAQAHLAGRYEPLDEGIADEQEWTSDRCLKEMKKPGVSFEKHLAAKARMAELFLTKRTLTAWQKSGVQKMLRDLMRFYGHLLADQMGLGKSMELLILALTDLPIEGPSLILTPLPLTHIQELVNPDVFGLEVSYYFHDGKQPHHLLNGQREALDAPLTTAQILEGGYRFVICSYQTLVEQWKKSPCQGFLWDICWNYLLCDECTEFKNANTLVFSAVTSLFAKKRVAASATPVETSPENLWTIMQFLRGYEAVQTDWRRHWGDLRQHAMLEELMVRREKGDLIACKKVFIRVNLPMSPPEAELQKMLQLVREQVMDHSPSLGVHMGQMLIAGCTAPWVWLHQFSFRSEKEIHETISSQCERLMHDYLSLDDAQELRYQYQKYADIIAQASRRETAVVWYDAKREEDTKTGPQLKEWVDRWHKAMHADCGQKAKATSLWKYHDLEKKAHLQFFFEKSIKIWGVLSLLERLILKPLEYIRNWVKMRDQPTVVTALVNKAFKAKHVASSLKLLVTDYYAHWMTRRHELLTTHKHHFWWEERHFYPVSIVKEEKEGKSKKKEKESKESKESKDSKDELLTFALCTDLASLRFFHSGLKSQASWYVTPKVKDVLALLKKRWIRITSLALPVSVFQKAAKSWLSDLEDDGSEQVFEDGDKAELLISLYYFCLTTKQTYEFFETDAWKKAAQHDKHKPFLKHLATQPLHWAETDEWRTFFEDHFMQDAIAPMSGLAEPEQGKHRRYVNGHQKIVVFTDQEPFLQWIVHHARKWFLDHKIAFACAGKDASFGCFWDAYSLKQLEKRASSWNLKSSKHAPKLLKEGPLHTWDGSQDMARDSLQFAAEVQVIFISTESRKGVTLTEAENIYMVDADQNPAINSQIIDRVHRLSQMSKKVYVYKATTVFPNLGPTFEYGRVISNYVRETEIIRVIGTHAQVQHSDKKIGRWSREEDFNDLLFRKTLTEGAPVKRKADADNGFRDTKKEKRDKPSRPPQIIEVVDEDENADMPPLSPS